MNLYLLFALAFGALTGAAEVRVRPQTVVSLRAHKRVAACGVSTLGGMRSSRRGMPHRRTETVVVRAIAVLTSAISPRAPAVNC